MEARYADVRLLSRAEFVAKLVRAAREMMRAGYSADAAARMVSPTSTHERAVAEALKAGAP